MTRLRTILIASAAPLFIAACSEGGSQPASTQAAEPATTTAVAAPSTAASEPAPTTTTAAATPSEPDFAQSIAMLTSSLTSAEAVAGAREAIARAVEAAPAEQVSAFLTSGYKDVPEAVRPAVHYAVAEAALAAFDNAVAISQVAADKALGYGTEKDLDGAMALLSRPELADSPSIMVQRATILLDESYAGKNREDAIALLKRAAEAGSEGAKARLAELGVGL